MTYWFLNTIHHLRWSFLQQLGGEILHFSLHLLRAINTSFGFLCFVWIKHIFTWNYHLSPDLNYGQWINTTSTYWWTTINIFCLFMFCIDPTEISAYFNISRIWLLKWMHWRVFHFILWVGVLLQIPERDEKQLFSELWVSFITIIRWIIENIYI